MYTPKRFWEAAELAAKGLLTESVYSSLKPFLYPIHRLNASAEVEETWIKLETMTYDLGHHGSAFHKACVTFPEFWQKLGAQRKNITEGAVIFPAQYANAILEKMVSLPLHHAYRLWAEAGGRIPKSVFILAVKNPSRVFGNLVARYTFPGRERLDFPYYRQQKGAFIDLLDFCKVCRLLQDIERIFDEGKLLAELADETGLTKEAVRLQVLRGDIEAITIFGLKRPGEIKVPNHRLVVFPEDAERFCNLKNSMLNMEQIIAEFRSNGLPTKRRIIKATMKHFGYVLKKSYPRGKGFEEVLKKTEVKELLEKCLELPWYKNGPRTCLYFGNSSEMIFSEALIVEQATFLPPANNVGRKEIVHQAITELGLTRHKGNGYSNGLTTREINVLYERFAEKYGVILTECQKNWGWWLNKNLAKKVFTKLITDTLVDCVRHNPGVAAHYFLLAADEGIDEILATARKLRKVPRPTFVKLHLQKKMHMVRGPYTSIKNRTLTRP